MLLDSLLKRRLVFLSGKGGVGKSVVGASLALAARNRGKRVLLVEIEAPLEASRYLGSGPVGGQETEILPDLFTVNLGARQVMDEYIRRTLRVELLARKVLDSPIYHRFFAAAPGLPELMLLGKILFLEEQRRRRRPRFDLVIIDAPATGHGLALLKVPLAASKAIPVGPIGNNARRILEALRDPKRTALAIVAVPEEMAVVEALQFHEMAADELGIEAAALFLNRCCERRLRNDEEAEVLRLAAEGCSGRLTRGVPVAGALQAAKRQIRRRKLTQFYRKRLRRALSLPLVNLPFLFEDELGPDSLATLAERIEAA